ncbi:hypothetical protein [Endozoicomonas sp. ALB115]|uniref:hypothetical protein n=1 Tax=Endozoicomonas sp. ALB115 TaxID=3403074 RepID=UPI003BB699C4
MTPIRIPEEIADYLDELYDGTEDGVVEFLRRIFDKYTDIPIVYRHPRQFKRIEHDIVLAEVPDEYAAMLELFNNSKLPIFERLYRRAYYQNGNLIQMMKDKYQEQYGEHDDTQ